MPHIRIKTGSLRACDFAVQFFTCRNGKPCISEHFEIIFPMTEPAITPELVAKHNLTPEEYEKLKDVLGPRAELHRAGHLLGDVERALLLQEHPPAAEDLPHQVAENPRRRGRGKRRHH